MPLLDDIDEQQLPGIDEGMRRKRGPIPSSLADMLDQPEETPPEYASNASAGVGGDIGGDLNTGRLAHRIADDQQTGNRSGGPAGGYQDPGAGRLAELMSRRKAMDAPAKGPGIGHRLLDAALQLAPMGAAAAFGGMGGPVGAEQGIEEGVARRHQLKDLATQRREAEKLRLSQEIDTEARAGEQRQFTHGEDVLRQQTAEHGMDARAAAAQAAETGRNQRLVETIEAQGKRQQAGFGQQDELERLKQEGRESSEDQKQQGRMALQRAKADAQMAVQRYKVAHPNANLPPVLTKAFAKYQDSQSRMDVMERSYEAAIRDPGNQQAMLNLLASHLGMTMGLQPGARMNKALIDEAKKSGYIDERIEAHFGPDGFMTGVVLTSRQMAQMMPLAQDRLMEDARAVKETEAYLGRAGAAPITPRVPGQAGPAGPGTAGGAGGAGATAAATPAAHKAGDVVTYKGKQRTIKEVMPDGRLVLNP